MLSESRKKIELEIVHVFCTDIVGRADHLRDRARSVNVIGNSYIGHYQPDGTIEDAADLKGAAIIAVALER